MVKQKEEELEYKPPAGWTDFLRTLLEVDDSDEEKRNYLHSIAGEGKKIFKEGIVEYALSEMMAAMIYEQGGDLAKEQGKLDKVNEFYKSAIEEYQKIGFKDSIKRTKGKMIKD